MPKPPSAEVILTSLFNEIAANPNQLIFVLDDYHHIDAAVINEALTFLLDHLPPQMHLVIATRLDPHLPLARLRARSQLTGSLCDALTGQENGQETLEILEHANLFIVPLDEERRWYRYYHLFADLLHQHLHQSLPDNMPILHCRVSEWYEQNGFADEAIKYAQLAKEFERAADLIEKVAETVWGRGEDTKLRYWLDKLPIEVLFAKPQLCIFHSWSLLATGQQDVAERSLHVVDQIVNYSLKPGAPDRLPDADTKKLQGRAAAT